MRVRVFTDDSGPPFSITGIPLSRTSTCARGSAGAVAAERRAGAVLDVPGMAQTAGVVTTGVAAAALCGYMLLAPSQRLTGASVGGQDKPRRGRLVTGIAQDELT